MDKKDSSIECFDPLQSDYAKESMSATSLNVASIQPSTSSSSSHPPLPVTSGQHGTQRTENCNQRNSGPTQANEPLRLRKKSQNILNRSDSTGSTSGRKFLAPTLSDPQAMRNEKYSQKKKAGTFSSIGSSTSTALSSTPIASTKTTFRKSILSFPSLLIFDFPILFFHEFGVLHLHMHNTNLCDNFLFRSILAASTIDNNQGLAHAQQILYTSNSHSGLSTVVSVSQHTMPSNAISTTAECSSSGGGTGGSNNINTIAAAQKHTLPAFHDANNFVHASAEVNCAQCGYSYSDVLHHADGHTCNMSKICAGSSSTGSNIAGSNSKVNSTATGANNSHTNVVFEVHDWWSDQVTVQQSSDEEDDDDEDDE